MIVWRERKYAIRDPSGDGERAKVIRTEGAPPLPQFSLGSFTRSSLQLVSVISSPTRLTKKGQLAVFRRWSRDEKSDNVRPVVHWRFFVHFSEYVVSSNRVFN